MWSSLTRNVCGTQGRLFFSKTVGVSFLVSALSGCSAGTATEVDSTDDPAVIAVHDYSKTQSTSTFDFSGKLFRFEMPSSEVLASTPRIAIGVGPGPDEGYSIAWQESRLVFSSKIAGRTHSFQLPYDPLQHRFWKIQHQLDRDVIEFATSPDGMTWTLHRSMRRELPLEAAAFYFEPENHDRQVAPAGLGVVFEGFSTDAL